MVAQRKADFLHPDARFQHPLHRWRVVADGQRRSKPRFLERSGFRAWLRPGLVAEREGDCLRGSRKSGGYHRRSEPVGTGQQYLPGGCGGADGLSNHPIRGCADRAAGLVIGWRIAGFQFRSGRQHGYLGL